MKMSNERVNAEDLKDYVPLKLSADVPKKSKPKNSKK